MKRGRWYSVDECGLRQFRHYLYDGWWRVDIKIQGVVVQTQVPLLKADEQHAGIASFAMARQRAREHVLAEGGVYVRS